MNEETEGNDDGEYNTWNVKLGPKLLEQHVFVVSEVSHVHTKI